MNNSFPNLFPIRLPCALCLITAVRAGAEQPRITLDQAEALVAGLHPRQGNIVLQDRLATLHVPPGFHFFDGADSSTVLVKLWGNPPEENPLGMLMPADAGPLSDNSWAVIITYEGDGYVKDADAQKINYSELLTQMQKDAVSGNAEREKAGYPPMQFVGWAKAPHYDQPTHKLYWAKEIKFGQSTENTLNYNIRMLGRGGVLVLNAVASMAQLSAIEKATPGILSAIDFNPGQRYGDFNPSSDKVATYGVAALVAGGVAAKLGFLKDFGLRSLPGSANFSNARNPRRLTKKPSRAQRFISCDSSQSLTRAIAAGLLVIESCRQVERF